MLTLQQAETTTPPAPPVASAPAAPVVVQPTQMVAPIIPEDMPLRCSYDADAQAYRCSYEKWFREPAIYTVAMVGILGFGLGFLIAAFPPVREAVKTAKSVSPV